MKANLSVRIDSTLVRFAKQYAKRNGKSVSSIVANYFAALPVGDVLPIPQEQKIHALGKKHRRRPAAKKAELKTRR